MNIRLTPGDARTWRLKAVASVSIAGLALSACAGSSGADSASSSDGPEPVTLSLATTQVEDALENQALWEFVDNLQEKAPWITIDYAGGPEVVDPAAAAESVQSGAFDMASVCSCYYTNVLPEVGALDLTPTSPAADRDNGAFELLSEWHDENGLHYLGGTYDRVSFWMHLGDNYETLNTEGELDLSGWLFRAPPTVHPAIEALGGEAVSMPVSDTYTAVDRGTVDGFVLANVGMYELGLADVATASINVDIGWVRYPLLMNPDTWDGLEEETQEAINDAVIQMEGELQPLFDEKIEEELQRMENDGKTLIQLDEEVHDEVQSVALDGMWDAVISNAPRAEQLREIYSNETD